MPLSDYIYDRLLQYLPFTPTQDQDHFFRSLSHFIQASPSDIMLVNGYAGTGKTSAMLALHETAKTLDIPLVMLAPTGRAAKVLASYSGHPAHTIHKAIYRQKLAAAAEEEASGALCFERHVNKHKNALFIVDEASLISDTESGSGVMFGSGRLLDDLILFVRSAPGNKILFMGDSAQLPPVGTSLSPALDQDYMRRYGEIDCVTMRQVIRQAASSGILYNATLLRLNIEKGICRFPSWRFSGFDDIHSIRSHELMESLTDAMDRYGEEEVAVLCRSNKRANRYNQGIRSSIQYREEQLTRGDRLMVVKNSYRFTAPSGEMDFIANGDVAQLLHITHYEERYGLHFADATLAFPDYNNTEVDAKVILDTLLSESPSLDRSNANRLWEGVWEDIRGIRGKAKRQQALRDDPYLNALQIKYAQAITCHKAQGGQWKAVFVEKAFFEENPDMEQLRWYYTAFTRAVAHLYLINFEK